MPTEWAAELRRHYFAAVSATDELLGSIVDELAVQGVANNTLVAFIGDHGRWPRPTISSVVFAGFMSL
jgi:iduronate 2-sulfatase